MRQLRTLGQRGVTLIEMLVVMGLLGLFLGILVTMFTSTIDVQGQTAGYSAVLSDGRFIMARLDYDIARASSISLPASLGASASSLVMTVNGATYSYDLASGNLELTDATGPADLNSNGSVVSGLTFQEIGSAGGKPTIKYSFTLTSTAHHSSGNDTQTFSSTAATQ